jgi:uncharacterized CHY-type Zn-finger protein
MPSKVDIRHKQIGGRHRAASRYAMLVYRVTHTELKKNKKYAGIQVLVKRDDFILWFMKNDFSGCSVDRINKDLHYELSNMQVIPLSWNAAKDKIKHINGLCVCYKCKQEKSSDEFVRSSRNLHNGLSTICKKCEANRTKNVSQESYLRSLERRMASRRDRQARLSIEESTGGAA